jgi:hypothetical protein
MRQILTTVRIAAIGDYADVFECDESLLYHVVEMREEGGDVFGGIDDFNDDGEVL